MPVGTAFGHTASGAGLWSGTGGVGERMSCGTAFGHTASGAGLGSGAGGGTECVGVRCSGDSGGSFRSGCCYRSGRGYGCSDFCCISSFRITWENTILKSFIAVYG